MYLGAFLGAFIADITQEGLLVLPLFSVGFGLVSLILAFFIIKETNKKILATKYPHLVTQVKLPKIE